MGGLAAKLHEPFMLDDLAEAIQHAIVRLGARTLAGLQLSRPISPCSAGEGRTREETHTLVLTTSKGYLVAQCQPWASNLTAS